MTVSPINKIPNPAKASATRLTLRFLLMIIIITPMNKKIGAIFVSFKAAICAVIVVPMLAPIKTGVA